MKKKIFFSMLVFLIAFAGASLLKKQLVFAATPFDILNGWLWGGSNNNSGITSGVGWVSLNSANGGSGGGTYAVMVPSPECAGMGCDVTGFGWSSNIGYIDFNPQDNCVDDPMAPVINDQYRALSCAVPAGYESLGVNGRGGVKRVVVDGVSDNLVGWARVVDIAKATAVGNAGGEDGWLGIGLGGGFDVSVNQTTGALFGMGWLGSTLGAVDFSGNVVIKPTLTLTPVPDPALFDVAVSVLPTNAQLTWSTTFATECAASGFWTDPNIGINGTKNNISISSGMNSTITVTCKGYGGKISRTISIGTICYPKSCNNQKCVNDLPRFKLGATVVADCKPDDFCSSDADCEPRETGKWIEVKP